jgi:hypothetical protein
MKDNGNDLLGNESPTDVCSPTPARKRLLSQVPTAVLEVEDWGRWKKMEQLWARNSEFYQIEHEEFLSSSVLRG